MKPIPVGTKGTDTRTVADDDLASHLDPTLAAVLSTPTMVAMMEHAAMDAIRTYLEPTELSPGSRDHWRGFLIEGTGNGTPAAASAACWRAASAASSKSSISSWKSWYQLSSALRCINTEPSPIAARS